MTTAADGLYLRVDASVDRGIGHFIRCLSLAQYWREEGRPCVFIGHVPSTLEARLAAEGVDYVAIDEPHPAPGDLDRTLRSIPRGATTVLDGYHFDERYQAVLDTHSRLLVVDDTGHHASYFGYALLNQNLDAHRVVYREAPRRRLLGLDFVLLGRDIRRRRAQAVAPAGPVARVLITMGGSDPGNCTALVIRALSLLGEGTVTARIIVGPLNPHRVELERLRGPSAAIEMVDAADDMGAHLEWASLVIAASGSTCWEIAALRRPSLIIATADNQIPIGRAMQAHGAAVYLGEAEHVTPSTVAAAIRDAIADPGALGTMADRAGRLIDGEGVRRVTRVLRGRRAVIDREMEHDVLAGRSVLVTGGTGSFGRHFVEFVLRKTTAARVVVFSRDELKQFEMSQQYAGEQRLRCFLGDVRDRERLHRAFDGIDVVVHAAALKQIPAAEYNPFEFVKTNVIGAQNIIDAAIDRGVRQVVALSSDKASSPVNLYGATKLVSDRLFIAGNSYAGQKQTRFSVVRYGNVLGSRGSVTWNVSRLHGAKSVDVTDARMTRFWITLGQAVRFVLASLAEMRGGEVFVPKVPSMRLKDLIEALAPGAAINVVGIRPGEKLHEEMISADEARRAVDRGDHYVILPDIVWTDQNHLVGKPLPDGFRYASDLNDDWLDRDRLATLLDA